MAGIYIHIPYCSHKCSYCNFFSLASRHGMDQYTLEVIREMELRKDYLNGEPIETVYFGGGTPSLLPYTAIREIISAASGLMPFAKDLEITLEANPEDLTETYVNDLRQAGVNRISVGVQSFFDQDLDYLGRKHNSAGALRALELLMEQRFPGVTADLIYGMPTLTDTQWLTNIGMLTDVGIPHISAYALTVEEKTPLSHYIQKGSRTRPDDEQAVHQYEMLMDQLETQGYLHYEISNFCLPGHHSRHNRAYWQGIPYLGLGPSAHSYNGHSRQWNVNSVSEYLSSVQNGAPACTIEMLTPADRYNEYIMTGIRTSEGISLRRIEEEFGKKKLDELMPITDHHIISEWAEFREGYFVLTRKGKLFADRIASELFSSG